MLKNYTVDLPPNGRVWFRFWEDECVVFHELSGQIHLIAEMGAFLLKLISEQPYTRSQLLAHFLNSFELSMDFNLEEFLDKLIIEYQNLGLLTVTENS
ncbi:MAG: HPr-rel-A system PqqD family peptide chaperone [Methylovulum miyakonense]|uniref:HPr-rel-A system PqqD family peptide chaperone n=1 Tax=Methylovulum miyakonense TaxID=645578 RepID=UPI003BB62A06